MKLIIAEKPSLAMNIIKAIGSCNKKDGYFVNDKYIITFAYGHLLQLNDIEDYTKQGDKKWILENLPYFPSKFEYKLSNESGVIKQYKIIEKLIISKDIDEIIACGDADREGEVIINNIIYNVFKHNKIDKKISRLWLPEQTETTILKSLKSLQDISVTKNLYNEGLARSHIDWLYGINFTRYVTILTSELFKVGRVIIPTVYEIYKRDKEIKEFTTKKFNEISGKIIKDESNIPINFNIKYDTNDDNIYSKFKELSENKTYVKNIENNKKELKPKKLFSLDTLQNYMFKIKKYSIDKTLSVVQALYEKGYLTYPRTNTEYLSEEEKPRIEEILNLLSKKENIKLLLKDTKSIFDSSKIESHSALTITNKLPNIAELAKEESEVYLAVYNRFISNFLDEKTIIDEVVITIINGDNSYKIKGETISSIGFLKYENILQEKVLPNFEINEVLQTEFIIEEKETKPPEKMSELKLNNFFKNPFNKEEKYNNDDEEYKNILNGIEIGTVATRAEIIKKIKSVGYVIEKGNKLEITEKGIKLIETLEKLDINLDKNKTVELSQNLKKIYKGSLTINELIEKVETEIKINFSNKDVKIDKCSNVNNNNILCKCPICNNNIIEFNKAYSCLGYKNSSCNFTIWKTIAGKNITKVIAKQICKNKITDKLDGFISKNKKQFSCKLKIEDKKVIFKFD